ncbi:uncharacterized protein LTR77_011202 [Saxophila tyrrhenica]|uniref:Smr domain-containing protein n=1 Tax=Saxophila tyrrhenica TaxID=1690608 RepID=A0AAV9NTJ2_9PEZI|nr:hypothetical protein LTR77_011202 [Saxophila tyrrhenica]
MDDARTKLEAEYCQYLDSALVSAICSDYELSDSTGVAGAREILESLKASASLEEAADFDPSGTGAGEHERGNEHNGESPPGTSGSASRETEATSLSNGLSSLGLDDYSSDTEPSTLFGQPEDFEALDEDGKVQILQSIVGDGVNQYSIRHALRKCKGDWDSAINDLLTQAFLANDENTKDGSAVNAKGVEGFYQENNFSRGRKGRSKGKRQAAQGSRRSSSVPGLGDASPSPASNKWTSATEDIDFIAVRTGIPVATVSSTYYSCGASVSRTIGALLKASMEESKYAAVDDDTTAIRADELGRDFPSISYEYRTTLIRVTHPSTSSAHELAKALTAKPKSSNGGGLQILTQYAPPAGVASSNDWSAVSRKAKSANASRSPSIDGPTATAQRDAYTAARAEALAKASAAHRKGKSDRLMGGAAGYYSQVGRDLAKLASSANAQAADQLAASQSTSTQLDLHGVDVVNAVRIAHEKVEQWWDGLGESRINGRVGADQRQGGYSIVVGLGKHSEGGKGKLGPAVTKSLKEDGWRVEAVGAVVVVKGPVKR